MRPPQRRRRSAHDPFGGCIHATESSTGSAAGWQAVGWRHRPDEAAAATGYRGIAGSAPNGLAVKLQLHTVVALPAGGLPCLVFFVSNQSSLTPSIHGERIPVRSLHFILGTMKAHPQILIIGLLRSPVSPADLDEQPGFFSFASTQPMPPVARGILLPKREALRASSLSTTTRWLRAPRAPPKQLLLRAVFARLAPTTKQTC